MADTGKKETPRNTKDLKLAVSSLIGSMKRKIIEVKPTLTTKLIVKYAKLNSFLELIPKTLSMAHPGKKYAINRVKTKLIVGSKTPNVFETKTKIVHNIKK